MFRPALATFLLLGILRCVRRPRCGWGLAAFCGFRVRLLGVARGKRKNGVRVRSAFFFVLKNRTVLRCLRTYLLFLNVHLRQEVAADRLVRDDRPELVRVSSRNDPGFAIYVQLLHDQDLEASISVGAESAACSNKLFPFLLIAARTYGGLTVHSVFAQSLCGCADGSLSLGEFCVKIQAT